MRKRCIIIRENKKKWNMFNHIDQTLLKLLINTHLFLAQQIHDGKFQVSLGPRSSIDRVNWSSESGWSKSGKYGELFSPCFTMLVLSWLLWGHELCHHACLSTINGKERFDQHTGVLTGENTVNTVNTLLTCVLFMFIVYITSLSHGLVLQQHGNTLLQNYSSFFIG